MGEHDRDQRLDAALGDADWTRGLTKRAVADRLAAQPDLQMAISHGLPDGTYFSAADVRNVLPDNVWRTLPPAGAPRPPDPAVEITSSSPSEEQTGGATGRLRQVVGSGTQTVTDRTTAVAARTRERAGSVTQAARDASASLPERARQTASQTRDQVVNIRTRRAEPAPAPSRPEPVPPADISSAVASIGQAYTQQPGKALIFAVAGLTLSVVSGLSTVLAQQLFGKKRARRQTDRLKPALAGFWLMTFALNAWSAWRALQSADPVLGADGGTGASIPTTWNDLDPTRDPAAPGTSATRATDEYPTVG